MYIILSIFIVYALGVISYEFNFIFYMFIIIFSLLLYNTIKVKKIIYNIVLFSFFILSIFICKYNSTSVLSQHIDKEISLIAYIKSPKISSNTSSRYNSFNATVINVNSKKLNSKENTIIYIDKNQKIDVNSIVRLKGSVTEPSISKNNLLFNYKNHLRSKKIYSTIFCTDKVSTIERSFSKLNDISINFINYAENLFESNLNKKNADIMLSIILGNVGYLDDGFYDNIKIMGLAHIFAVSGSHIVLLYGAMLKILVLIGVKKRISWLITWSLIWFYGFLIGFPISVMRTLVMFTLLFGSEVLYRRYSSLNSIALAALILTIINPFWLFDAGFLLSFSAALGLILYSKYINKNVRTENKIIKIAYMYVFLQIFMIPVMAYFFNYIPIMGVIYNIILIPIFTYLLILGFTLLLFNSFLWYVFIILFKILDYSLNLLRYFIDLTENIAFNGIIISTLSIYEIIFFYFCIGFLLFVYNKKINCSLIGYTILTSFYLLTNIIIPMTDTGLYFNIADVGQGLFTTLTYKNYNFIFDCGSTSNKNVGKYTVVPYLTKKGINKIDGIFISHWDLDHYSGIFDILETNHIKVKNVISSYNNENIDYKILTVNNSNYIQIDNDFKIRFLWPYDEFITDNINNSSLVPLIRYNDRYIIIPGDIEEYVENMILNEINRADILIVPHHGSDTSSSESFVNSVCPNFSVMSYGTNNYGIPSAEVIKRYKTINSNILSTFNHGEINFILKNDKLYYNTYIGNKSNNYYELYFEWIIPKLFLFLFLLAIIIYNRVSYEKTGKEVIYELQNYK
ncbi:MAG: DNA internalization-related competence protein ComEC/Rec2 [Tissierellia bacterium]|nr:DNA internalization-related competence protein ComEC/Rec2 [Tissierellia bacterium]